MRVRTSVLTLLLSTGLTVLPAAAVERTADDPDRGMRMDNRFTQAELQAQAQGTATAANLPADFAVETVFSGLNLPTAVRFAPDGRVFVAEKGGAIKAFDSLTDPSATTVIDLSNEVYGWWDRGLLGLAVHPDFPATPYIYALYAWDLHGYGDTCPSPPGDTNDGCLADSRLVRLQVSASNSVVSSTTLLEGNWCQQYPSHSVGTLEFGPGNALYVSAGDGASFNFADYGQGGGDPGSPTPSNPCGDPPVPVGGTQSASTGQGGALRSQDLRTSGDPVTFDGTVLRIDPLTGAALPDNPLTGGAVADDDRVVAYGLRNPFRITVRPGTQELWIGDVGWGTWEEIDRHPNPTQSVRNFGWPCYEGTGRQPSYDGLNNNVCETLYTQAGAVDPPHYTYQHGVAVNGCPEPVGSASAITGVAFYPGGDYPAEYDGALFFTDYSRSCVWVMFPDASGVPVAANRIRFASSESSVGLYAGPDGDIYSVDIGAGAIKRFVYTGTNTPPTAVATADVTSGPVPLTVSFSSAGSADADSDPITYAWDLDGDGAYDDSTAANPTYTYTTVGTYQVGLRVSDNRGGTGTDQLTIDAGNTAPTARILTPDAALQWAAGEQIEFSGDGNDAQDGALAGTSLRWSLDLHHCAFDLPTDCHVHHLQDFTGASGSFFAPDHEYPAYVTLTLTATDSAGATGSDTLRLDPRTVDLTFRTDPTGLELGVGSRVSTTEFTRTLIVNAVTAVSAPPTQVLGETTYQFVSWSDGGAATHNVTVGATPATYTASYAVVVANRPPTVQVQASPSIGVAPLTVTFTTNGSSDPDGDTLTFAWDLDNDGAYDDATGATASRTFASQGTYWVKVRASDGRGGTDVAQVKVRVTRKGR